MTKLLIKNIKQLVQVREGSQQWLAGKDMQQLPVLNDAWLLAEDGIIKDYGLMADWQGVDDWSDLEVIDATGKLVLPAWCDSHTHLVFAASREQEFVDRIHGLSYEEIAARGGGILNSAKKLKEASEEDLLENARKRLELIQATGTGAVEIKSGYGLSLEAELKILRVVKTLKEESDIPIKATFLGAHAYPAAFKENHQGYIDLVVNEMIPQVAEEGLAEYVDVFCEKGYFDLKETEQVVQAGIDAGLTPKIHVNQFNAFGGIPLAVRLGALSVDHLEQITDEDIEALKGSSTIPTALPSCSFFLNIPYCNGRKIIDEGLPLALATDFNPGSTPSGNIPFVLSLACIKMRLTPEEVINAATLNGAYAMGLEKEMGSITRGKKANLILTKAIPSYQYIPYSFGENIVERLFV